MSRPFANIISRTAADPEITGSSATSNNHAGRSLYVRLKGPLSGKGARGKWTDCATANMAICSISSPRGKVSLPQGYARRGAAIFEAAAVETPTAGQGERSSDRDTITLARKIWAASRPIIGTQAEAYLRARKITADLDPAALRYHPALFYRERPGAPSRTLPALVAAVTNHDGEIMGVHRTWLDPARKDKARVSSPRRSLGAILGNGVASG